MPSSVTLGADLGRSSGSSFGWGVPQTPILLVMGLVLLVLFPFIENRVKDPILPMDIFKSTTFVVVSISLCLGWMSFGMFQFYNPSFLMELRHISSLEVALQMLPCALIGFVAATTSVILLPRVPGYFIFGASMLSFFIGQLLLALTPVNQTYWAMTFPTCLLIGFGPDLSFACASLIASDNLKPDQQGVAGSFINTIVNYSISLGLALASNVEVHVNDGGRDKLRGFRGAFYLGMGFAGLGIIFTAVFHNGMAKRHKAD
jgi:predicted MFS family arabinose efflux permease